jgi:cytoskeletal protein CcmA (bactofilin family)
MNKEEELMASASTGTNDEFPTIIGADARFKGELEFEKGVRLLGSFEGAISTKGRLHVASGAALSAEVNAGEIQVEGEVKGNLNATGKVHLKSTAKLEGDLRTARLEVAVGAVFVGNCVVGPQNGTREKQASSSPAVRPQTVLGDQAPPSPAGKKGAPPQPAAAGK